MGNFIPQDADGNLILGVSSSEFNFPSPTYIPVDGSGSPLSGGSGGSSSSVTRTTSFANVSSSGTIAAGAKSVAFVNIGSAPGTLKGVPFPPGAAVSLDTNGGDTLDAVPYDATNTNFFIAVMV